MLESYFEQEKERAKAGLPSLPLTPPEVEGVCRFLEKPEAGKTEIFLTLLRNRVSPGVDPAAKVKAAWLTRVAQGKVPSPAVSRSDAVFLLGTMLGGYNVEPLVAFLNDRDLAAPAAEALKKTVLIYGHFDTVLEMSRTNPQARSVLESWAKGEWFLSRPGFPKGSS